MRVLRSLVTVFQQQCEVVENPEKTVREVVIRENRGCKKEPPAIQERLEEGKMKPKNNMRMQGL